MGAAAQEIGDRMSIVVSDTGPILHLIEADALRLLEFDAIVHVPKAVVSELAFLQTDLQLPDWIEVTSLDLPFSARAVAWQQAGLLDPGEAEAIALTQQLSADWLLTDGAAARVLAESLGLEVHGSLGIVLWAAAEGHINQSQANNALSRLANSSLWISQRILRRAWDALHEIFRV